MSDVLVVPGTMLEVTAHVIEGRDLCVVVNARNGACLGRILIQQLCQFEDLSRVNIGEFRLVPEPHR